MSDDGGSPSAADGGLEGDVTSAADAATDGARPATDGGDRDAMDAGARRDALGYPARDAGPGLSVACSRAVKGIQQAAVDRAGALVVLTDLSTETELGAGPVSGPGAGDLLVAKYDASCNLLWTRVFGDSRPQSFWRLAIDESEDIVVYGLDRGAMDFGSGPVQSLGYGNAVLAKLSPTGPVRWSKSWGAAYVWPGPITVGPDGEIAIGGMFGGDLALGGPALHGGPDVVSTFIAKLDTNGNHLWSHKIAQFLPTASQAMQAVEQSRIEPVALAFNANGDVVAALQDSRTDAVSAPIDLGGGPLAFSGDWYTRMSYVAQYDASGLHAWSVGHRGRTVSIAVDPAGYVVSSEETHDPLDPQHPGFRLSRRSPAGATAWSKELVAPGSGERRVFGAASVDSSGRPLLLASFFGTFTVDGTGFISDVDDPAGPTYFWDAVGLHLGRDAQLLWGEVPTAMAAGHQSVAGHAHGANDHIAALLTVVGTVTIGGATYTHPAGTPGSTLVLVHYVPGP
jgi:hypothetical protein